MWLSKQIQRQREHEKGQKERVLGSSDVLQLSGNSRDVEIILPFGLYAVPPLGTTAVLLRGENLCLGVLGTVQPVQEGEVCLYSAGGARILLKNNGEVVINDQVFAAREDGSV